MPYISLILIGEKDDNRNVMIELVERITSKLKLMKSDFSYNSYFRSYDDHLLFVSDDRSYTDRKFNSLINKSLEGSSLNISDFNIEKTHNRDTNDWFIKITKK